MISVNLSIACLPPITGASSLGSSNIAYIFKHKYLARICFDVLLFYLLVWYGSQ